MANIRSLHAHSDMANILFLHAHPDDEAIFTGGTIAALSEAGHNITVVFATGGELGATTQDQDLSSARRDEAIEACKILGAKHIHFLGFHDSGLDRNNFPPKALATADLETAALQLSGIMKRRKIDTLFCDDEFGVYGHPDHVKCHEMGFRAAEIHGLDCVMESTVDGEHLHFVETHVVEHAVEAFGIDPKSALFRDRSKRQHAGLTTAEISSTVKVNGAHLRAKRLAMAAHSSQIPPSSEPLQFTDAQFESVYGHEWFRHVSLTDGHKPGISLLDGLS